mmetsp:Transcript_70001/g.216438  ORF Transcript_70001/g.216438 Transcript_70001/m.216438 type:complete len:238 (-) Transcript_70001:103-816(-)
MTATSAATKRKPRMSHTFRFIDEGCKTRAFRRGSNGRKDSTKELLLLSLFPPDSIVSTGLMHSQEFVSGRMTTSSWAVHASRTLNRRSVSGKSRTALKAPGSFEEHRLPTCVISELWKRGSPGAPLAGVLGRLLLAPPVSGATGSTDPKPLFSPDLTESESCMVGLWPEEQLAAEVPELRLDVPALTFSESVGVSAQSMVLLPFPRLLPRLLRSSAGAVSSRASTSPGRPATSISLP